MATTKHTPSPWAVSVPEKGQDGYPHNWSISHESPTRAVYVASIPGAVHYERAQADARLIAAAPDMLEALQELLADKYLSDPINADRMAKARAALAKATEAK